MTYVATVDLTALDKLPLILRLPEVCRFIRISESTLRRRIKDGTFPKPWAYGPLRWRREDIEAHLRRRQPGKKAARALGVGPMLVLDAGVMHEIIKTHDHARLHAVLGKRRTG